MAKNNSVSSTAPGRGGSRVTGQGRGGSAAPKGRGGLVPFAGGKGTVKRGGQAL